MIYNWVGWWTVACEDGLFVGVFVELISCWIFTKMDIDVIKWHDAWLHLIMSLTLVKCINCFTCLMWQLLPKFK